MPATLTLALLGVFFAVALVAGSATYLVFERQSAASLRRRLAGAPESNVVDPEAPMDTEQAGASLKKVATFIPKSPKEMTEPFS